MYLTAMVDHGLQPPLFEVTVRRQTVWSAVTLQVNYWPQWTYGTTGLITASRSNDHRRRLHTVPTVTRNNSSPFTNEEQAKQCAG